MVDNNPRVRDRAAVAQPRAPSASTPRRWPVTGANPTSGRLRQRRARQRRRRQRHRQGPAPVRRRRLRLGHRDLRLRSRYRLPTTTSSATTTSPATAWPASPSTPTCPAARTSTATRSSTTTSAPTTSVATASTDLQARSNFADDGHRRLLGTHGHMTIRGNHIRDNAIGIWLSTTVTAHGLAANHFHHVPAHVVVG